jgi:hypothetical protein
MRRGVAHSVSGISLRGLGVKGGSHYQMTRKLRLVVLGMMGRCPFAGQSWLYLNWLLGFRRLGHDVHYIEDDIVWPYDPEQNAITDDCRYAVNHIGHCMERIGLADRWGFRLADHKDACWGITPRELDDLYRTCDILLNIVGATELREEQMVSPFRVYIETDPVTAELRVAKGDEYTRGLLSAHHTIVTYGENYGAPDCDVPLNGVTYHKTRQPVDLDFWHATYDTGARLFTTIGNYRQEGKDVEYGGSVYRWSKHHEWERFLDLPRRTSQRFELAVKVDAQSDRERLSAHGWRLISPLTMSLDVFGAYPDYIRRSRAEFTVAKDQNVRLRSGWFSERDACYLASGKPVIAQDTGFSNILPTGEGLFSFITMEEILAAIDAINSDYPRHCTAARAIAEEYFNAEDVAKRLLGDLGF